ncbi:MAG: DUF971 domain-containing protein [Verrucomicrobia bacterium]|nr:DUF971 domain-containing protein [Verrucomicrobiota bacterium]
MSTPVPQDIQLIGNEVAILWQDGRESFLAMDFLRAQSPSAANKGEPDIFGRIHGADTRTSFPGVRVDSFDWVGTYAIRFNFSDGHNTGLFSYKYLAQLSFNPESLQS